MSPTPTPTPPLTRHGAHRSARRSRGVLTALMPSLLAVAAVSALITSLAVWQGEEPGQPSAAASTPRVTGSTSASASASATASASASASATASASAGTPSAEAPAGVARETEVVVLNQTSRAGLAGSVADRLRTAGWTVPVVGNFRGVVPATTVYYPDGAQAQAQAVAADLPVEPRLRPRFGNLSTSRLTVVVTDSYPG